MVATIKHNKYTKNVELLYLELITIFGLNKLIISKTKPHNIQQPIIVLSCLTNKLIFLAMNGKTKPK
jgi:hypothetical protein